MPKKYRVKLSKVQREKLEDLTSSGTIRVRKYKRARILLLTDENHPKGGKTDAEIAEQIGRNVRSVERKLNLIRSL